MTYTQASNVGVMISVAPFFTAIFGCIFLHGKRPGFRFFAGLTIALAGVCIISFQSVGGTQINPLGDLLAIAAAVVWAAYSTLTKKISTFGCNTLQATRRTFFYGLFFMAPTLFFMDFHLEPAQFTNLENVLNLLFLGLGASAICFVTWNSAVKMLGALKTSVYIYLVPVITVATSALVLHEMITPAALGIILTLAGLFLSEKRAKRGCASEESTN